jgi:vitamin B12 transporter
MDRVILRAGVTIAALNICTGHGRAQALTPPTLLERADAQYPEAALAQRLEATVLLKLTIDTSGAVREATVLEPAGNGFDEAARAAALRFRFAPARRGEEAIVSSIRYAFQFTLPPEQVAPPGPAAAPPGEAPTEPAAQQPGAQGSQPPSAAATLAQRSPPAATPPTAAATQPPPNGRPLEISVRGQRSDAQQLQQSAEAVNVVETRKAGEQSADLGEVLARTQGVAVRRDGGLGSDAHFSLNGLYDDQVRFFLDGVPLELSGFPFGLANVPVNLIERVEVYRGVVPIRFGADALGGAVNLVTPDERRSYLSGSYQVGEFGTHRATLDARYRDPNSGFVAGASAFLDMAQNNYDIDVKEADASGVERPVRVPRFHDAYRAGGATLELGLTDKPWAKRLLLKGFGSGFDKQLQHNAFMTRPYGEPTYGETIVGATGRYDVALARNLELEVTANYSHRIIDFRDTSHWSYDWFGRRVHEQDRAGETAEVRSDRTFWQNAGFARALLDWKLAREHTVRVSLSPTYTARTGHERIRSAPDAPDPQDAVRALFTLVSGLEYQLDLFDERLSNIAFIKDYLYRADTEERLPSGGERRASSVDSHTAGVGDALRVRIAPFTYIKASYEYATRLPRPDEVFGNGGLVRPTLGLRPEVSHNANFGPHVELRRSAIGELLLDINVFFRESDRLIVLLGNDVSTAFQNVFKARGFGVENALSWTSPRHLLRLDGMLTWQDFRNISQEGAFKDLEGDRIPNRPYLFGSWGARLHFGGVPGRSDALEPFYYGRYVHSFYRTWESLGIRAYKPQVDAQLTHDIGVTWIVNREVAHTTFTLEVQNITDARVYDNYGVQRPGRAFYAKLTVTLH